MATKPTPGGSDGTYGTELNAFLDVSLDTDGDIKDGAVFTTSAAPTVDAGVANKKYVDDQNVTNSGAIKAWVNFDGDDGNVNDSFNVTSVSRTATGRYTITWDTNFADGNYAIAGFANDGANIAFVCNPGSDAALQAGTATIQVRNTSAANVDCNVVTVIAIGNQ